MEVPLSPPLAWPLAVTLKLLGEASSPSSVSIRAGMNTLVGPNGSGKTRALRVIKSALEASPLMRGRKVHFLAAGRTSPLDAFRAAVNGPGQVQTDDAAVGHESHRRQWWQIESVTGSLLALDTRPDLRLKVEARLQQLFDRSVRLAWSQTGLAVRIVPTDGGAPYAANHEASGILQLVALLAAIHNDEIGALLIDEPEISLHPQHQAFLLEEMEEIAGDPTEAARKVIVVATHSPTLLPLRSIDDLPALIFFSSARSAPTQVPLDAPVLKRAKLRALISRMSATHRLAIFAERVLLVEGASDEIVTAQLARRLGQRLLARNAQILPVNGKGQFAEAATLFRLMNKQVTIVADLDALADDNALVNSFSNLPTAVSLANGLGRPTLVDLDRDLRHALRIFMDEHMPAVAAAAKDYDDWCSSDSEAMSCRRVTLARILTDPQSFDGVASADACSLRTRFQVLLDALNVLGCFVLRRGAIESYFAADVESRGKPDAAAQEAATFDKRERELLRNHYQEVSAALAQIAPNQQVDEDVLLRPKLGAVLTAAFLSMEFGTTDEKLNSCARGTIGSDAEVFKLSNVSKDKLRLRVAMASPLFQRSNFPFEIGCDENPNLSVPRVLPGLGS